MKAPEEEEGNDDISKRQQIQGKLSDEPDL
jgi:hypothetical protein